MKQFMYCLNRYHIGVFKCPIICAFMVLQSAFAE